MRVIEMSTEINQCAPQFHNLLCMLGIERRTPNNVQICNYYASFNAIQRHLTV